MKHVTAICEITPQPKPVPRLMYHLVHFFHAKRTSNGVRLPT